MIQRVDSSHVRKPRNKENGVLIEWQVSLCMPSLFLVINQANSEVKFPISITNDKYFCYFKVSLSIESDVSTLAGHSTSVNLYSLL